MKAVGGLERDEEFVRFSDELRQFLIENRLIIGSNDLAAPLETARAGEVMLILHPAALQWREKAESDGQSSESEQQAKVEAGIFAR